MSIDINKARQHLKKKNHLRQQKLDMSFKKAQNDFDAIIAMIKLKYNPAKIVQWGSLLNRELFTEVSGIDIAVEGIKNAKDISLY